MLSPKFASFGGRGDSTPGFKPFPELAFSGEDDFQDMQASDMGKLITDRDASGDDFVQIALPELDAAIATGKSIMMRSTRKGLGEKFIAQPHWNDIAGYWSRLVSVGSRLCEFSVAMMDAGQSLILTPRQVGQMQLHLSSVTGIFAIGDTITGSDSEAIGAVLDVVLDKDGNTVLQIKVTAGTFTSGDTITNEGDGEGTVFRAPVDCEWMWQGDFVTGTIISSDEGNQRYQNWY